MRALSTFLNVTSETATALLNVGSIAVATGAAATICTQRLRYGVIAGCIAFLVVGALFGRGIWRTYGPQPGPRMFTGRRRRARA